MRKTVTSALPPSWSFVAGLAGGSAFAAPLRGADEPYATA
jgi:hypothetical protein